MTTTEQRNADEALGSAAGQLERAATNLGLIISKKWMGGLWVVEVVAIDTTLKFKATGTTELSAIDQVLDQLNHVQVVVV